MGNQQATQHEAVAQSSQKDVNVYDVYGAESLCSTDSQESVEDFVDTKSKDKEKIEEKRNVTFNNQTLDCIKPLRCEARSSYRIQKCST